MMSLIQTMIWELINKKNAWGKAEIDYLINETKNPTEKRKLKKIKKAFSLNQTTFSVLDDELIIKLIDSKIILKKIILRFSKEKENKK